MISPTQRPLPDNTRHSCPRRNSNSQYPSKRATADPCLGPCSHSIRLSRYNKWRNLRGDNVENYRAVKQIWTVLWEINTTQQYTLCKFLIRPTYRLYNQKILKNNLNLNHFNVHHSSAIVPLYTISTSLSHCDTKLHPRMIGGFALTGNQPRRWQCSISSRPLFVAQSLAGLSSCKASVFGRYAELQTREGLQITSIGSAFSWTPCTDQSSELKINSNQQLIPSSPLHRFRGLLSKGINSFVCMIQVNQSIGQVFLLPARSYSVIYIIPAMFHCIQKDQLMWYIWTAGSHWTITMPSTMSHDLMAILQNSRRGKQWVSHTGENPIKCLDRFQRKQIALTNTG